MTILERHTDANQKKISFSRLMDGGFNNQMWRKLLKDTCSVLQSEHPTISAISPFGFELLENKSFLHGQLRRFYIYVGEENGSFDLANKFGKVLFEKLLKIDSCFLNDVVILIENDQLIKLKKNDYFCLPTDKLIDIQVRTTQSDVLSDYADYIIASLVSIDQEKGEVAGFRESKKFRWRLYQLYLMHEKLFGQLLQPLTAQQLHSYKVMAYYISNRIDIFYNGNIEETLSADEKSLVDNLIKPRIKQMIEAITPGVNERKFTLQCCAYHYNDKLELTLGELHYQCAVNKIKASYLRYV